MSAISTFETFENFTILFPSQLFKNLFQFKIYSELSMRKELFSEYERKLYFLDNLLLITVHSIVLFML